MKRPPVQFSDEKAKELVEEFIAKEDWKNLKNCL
jgi:hypothetical protein